MGVCVSVCVCVHGADSSQPFGVESQRSTRPLFPLWAPTGNPLRWIGGGG